MKFSNLQLIDNLSIQNSFWIDDNYMYDGDSDVVDYDDDLIMLMVKTSAVIVFLFVDNDLHQTTPQWSDDTEDSDNISEIATIRWWWSRSRMTILWDCWYAACDDEDDD